MSAACWVPVLGAAVLGARLLPAVLGAGCRGALAGLGAAVRRRARRRVTPRRRRARPRLRRHPRCAVRPGRRRAARAPAPAPPRGVRRARRDRPLVADPARSREPRARRQFSAAVERAIRTTEAWTEREPQSAEAWFYLGGAYAARVQWRVLRDEKLAAARDGKRIKQALERAIALDPDLDDAYFGLGLYQVLRRRRAGRREVPAVPPAAARAATRRRARADAAGARARAAAAGRGRLPAAHRLSLVRAARRPRRRPARVAARPLSRQSALPAQIADIQDRYQHDITASLATWRALLAAARERRVNDAALAEAQARLGIARQLEALCQTDLALEQLRAVIARSRREPSGALAAAYLRSAKRTTASGTATRRSRPTGWRSPPARRPTRRPSAQRAADRMRRAPDPDARRGVPAVARRLRQLETATSPAPSALARSVALDREGRRRALSLRPRAAGAEGRRGGARAVRARDPRGARLSAADPRRRLPRSRAPARAARARDAGARRTTAPRILALRRRRRHARRGDARAHPPSRRQIDRFGATGPPSRVATIAGAPGPPSCSDHDRVGETALTQRRAAIVTYRSLSIRRTETCSSGRRVFLTFATLCA